MSKVYVTPQVGIQILTIDQEVKVPILPPNSRISVSAKPFDDIMPEMRFYVMAKDPTNSSPQEKVLAEACFFKTESLPNNCEQLQLILNQLVIEAWQKYNQVIFLTAAQRYLEDPSVVKELSQ